MHRRRDLNESVSLSNRLDLERQRGGRRGCRAPGRRLESRTWRMGALGMRWRGEEGQLCVWDVCQRRAARQGNNFDAGQPYFDISIFRY